MRKSCILMHISSIPSKYGIGKLGRNAYDFVDFLVKSGVKCWQILPLNPTSYGDSPYSSFSAYAGNPYFIDLDELVKSGLEVKRLLNNNRKEIDEKAARKLYLSIM